MKIKTSCEIATMASLAYFGTRPKEGLIWIEEIYNAARREAAMISNLTPIINAAIDVGQSVEKEIQHKKTVKKAAKPQNSRGGGETARK